MGRPEMAAHQMRQSSMAKATALGHQPNQIVYSRQHQPYDMWNSNAANWYYYHGNSFAQQHPQNQAYISVPGTSMQPTFSTYMPHYYTQQQQLPRIEVSNMQQRQLQGQVQGQRQGQGQLQAGQTIWYQAQQPQQNYNYWYAMPHQPFSMAQVKPVNVADNKPQSFYQIPTPSKPPEMQNTTAQSINTSHYSTYPVRTAAGSRAQGHCYIPHVSSGNGSLNRIDSVSSFKNHEGSRIRNSRQDLVEYRRIAARTLCEKHKKAAEEGKKQGKETQNLLNQSLIKPSKSVTQNTVAKVSPSIVKLYKQSHERRTDAGIQDVDVDMAHTNKKRIKTVHQNVVIGESVSARGSSFFHKLGLFKGGKRSSIFSMMRKHPRAQSIEPSSSSPSTSESTEIRPKTGRKMKFLKRFFSDDHYPLN